MAIWKEMAKVFFGEFEELLLSGASRKKALLGAACVVQEEFDLYPDDPDDDEYFAGFGVAGIARKDVPEDDAPNADCTKKPLDLKDANEIFAACQWQPKKKYDAPNANAPPIEVDGSKLPFEWKNYTFKYDAPLPNWREYVPPSTPMMPVPSGAAYVVPVKGVKKVVDVQWVFFGGKLQYVRIRHDDGAKIVEDGEIAMLLHRSGLGPDWFLVEMLGGVRYLSPDEFKHFVKV